MNKRLSKLLPLSCIAAAGLFIVFVALPELEHVDVASTSETRITEQRPTRRASETPEGAATAASTIDLARLFGVCAGCNVLLISVDTLRADHTSALGYARMTTPHLDRFATRSALFEQAIAQGTTSFLSYASVLTAQYPAVHRIIPNKPLRDEARTLAEELQEAGYVTAAIVGGMEMLNRLHNFSQGFSSYLDDNNNGFEEILPIAENWLASHRDGNPFFLFLQAYDVHDPYHSFREHYFDKGGYDGPLSDHTKVGFFTCIPCGKDDPGQPKLSLQHLGVEDGKLFLKEPGGNRVLGQEDVDHLIDHYDGGILSADEALGPFLWKFDTTRFASTTIVIIFADHGESVADFLDRKQLRYEDPAGRVRTIAGHGTVYDEVVHVPLIIRIPGMAPTRIASQVELIDIAPTIIDALGIEPSNQWIKGSQGQSLVPFVAGATKPSTRYAFSQDLSDRPPYMIRTPEWKYIDQGSGGILYNLREDPRELHDVVAEHPEIEDELAEALRAWQMNNLEKHVSLYSPAVE